VKHDAGFRLEIDMGHDLFDSWFDGWSGQRIAFRVVPVEIPIDHNAFLECVRSRYGFEVMQLEYLNAGMVSAYRMTGPSGTFFLKLFPNTPYGHDASARLEGEHSLLLTLLELNVLERIPAPVRALDGGTISSFQGSMFAVYGFIEGHTIWATWQDSFDGIAEILGRLHAASPWLLARNLKLPMPKENFELPFETRLLEDLRALQQATSASRSGVLALRDLLLPRRDELLGLLGRAKEFQLLVRNRSKESVIAHTDLHGGNLLLDPAGELWALDWETARVAPAEHDLWMFHSKFTDFIPAYERALGRRCEMDFDLIAFYFYRRNLEDLAVNVQLIIDGGRSDEQDFADIEGVREYGLEAWPNLKPDLGRVRVFIEGTRLRHPNSSRSQS
jgi:spectinomycin phosphotransferase